MNEKDLNIVCRRPLDNGVQAPLCASINHDLHRRITDQENTTDDHAKLVGSLNVSIEKILVTLESLKTIRDDVSKLENLVDKNCEWINENKKIVEGIDEEGKKIEEIQKELASNRPIIKAILSVSSALIVAGIGLITTYLFTGKTPG